MRAVIIPLLFLAVMTAGAGARGETGGSVFIEELTWTELRDQIAAGKTIAIVPIGGTEQNGPHMAVGKHNLRVKLLAGKIAAALGTALVAPVLAYVPEGEVDRPSGHLRFPGTITVPEDTFEKTIESAARSLQLHGFRDIVFLGDHGSTQTGEEAVARRLNRLWAGKPARAHAVVEYYRASEAGFARLLESRGYPASEIGTHAGLADTALMMALDPALVRADRLRPGDGVNGDPHRATAELGALGVDLVVDETVAAIKQAVTRH
ncbi:MAG: creatininase family protein [Alphaproteobacteria bacterium]|nr:MAG: creatininase family protein [Alphaproteobacteria bacterium]